MASSYRAVGLHWPTEHLPHDEPINDMLLIVFLLFSFLTELEFTLEKILKTEFFFLSNYSRFKFLL